VKLLLLTANKQSEHSTATFEVTPHGLANCAEILEQFDKHGYKTDVQMVTLPPVVQMGPASPPS
jgi:hypothetical protein